MKLSFSTVGCPKWSWSDIVTCAVDLGYNGIEIRGVGDDLFLPDARVFQPENLPKTRADLEKHGLAVSCLASDVLLHNPTQDAQATLERYISLAQGLGAKGIRVLGDTWGEPGQNVDAALAEERLNALAPLAENAGIELWIETNGIWADTTRLRAMLDRIASPAVGVVWDIHHPVRYFNESPEATAANIGALTRHVHVKDSDINESGELVYKMLGYGSLPVMPCLKALHALGYGGYVSMEWVKRWNQDLEDAGIVFSHFAYQMRRYLSQLNG